MERSSATPKSRAPSTRVTSGVRRVGGGAASITLPTTPGHMTVGKVPLLCNTGGIFETLESHQVSWEKFPFLDCVLNSDNNYLPTPIHFVYQSTHMHTRTQRTQMSLQSLEGTVAAASFADDLQKWHKQLQTIEAVLRVWLKVQLLWSQLEGVRCIGGLHIGGCICGYVWGVAFVISGVTYGGCICDIRGYV